MTAIMGRDKNHFQGTYKMLNSFALRAILRDRTRQLGWLAAYEQTEEEEKKTVSVASKRRYNSPQSMLLLGVRSWREANEKG